MTDCQHRRRAWCSDVDTNTRQLICRDCGAAGRIQPDPNAPGTARAPSIAIVPTIGRSTRRAYDHLSR